MSIFQENIDLDTFAFRDRWHKKHLGHAWNYYNETAGALPLAGWIERGRSVNAASLLAPPTSTHGYRLDTL